MKIVSVLTLALLSTALAAAGVKAQDYQNQRYQRNQPQNQQEQQNQDACMNDAMTICGQFVPDRDKVAACLLSNKHRVSVSCRMALSHWHG